MSLSLLSTLRRSTKVGTLALAAIAGMSACADSPTNASNKAKLPQEPTANPSLKSAAFTFDVDLTKRIVKVTSPTGATGTLSFSPTSRSAASLSKRGANMSILAGDVIELTTSNFAATGVGAGGAPAGKINVKFDVQIFNRLGSVRLIRPTFPTAPSGLSASQNVLLFPYSVNTTVTSGGTGTEGDGSTVVVELPSFGEVVPNADWDGTPWNFFNDDCSANSNDCFRYEAFPTIQPNETTAGRSVGFTIDPTVNKFRARLIVAADLENAVAQFGTIAGTISSSTLGNLSGVTVSAGAGFTAVTNASGAYSIANVPVGARTVTVTGGLPAGRSCTTPAGQGITVTNAATSTVNFAVAGCTAPSAGVTGQLNSTISGQILSGVSVTLTPDAGPAAQTIITSGTGSFSASFSSATLPNPLTGRITAITGLPTGCTVPTFGAGLFTFSVANDGTVAIPAITITCPTPPITYPLIGTWSAGGLDTVKVTFSLTLPSGAGRTDNAGAQPDTISGLGFDVIFDNTKLAPVTSPASKASVLDASSPLDSKAYNPALAANTARMALFSTAGGKIAGNASGAAVTQGLVTLVFRRIAAGSVAVSVSVSDAPSPSGQMAGNVAPSFSNIVP